MKDSTALCIILCAFFATVLIIFVLLGTLQSIHDHQLRHKLAECQAQVDKRLTRCYSVGAGMKIRIPCPRMDRGAE